jgi:hypothetical protein
MKESGDNSSGHDENICRTFRIGYHCVNLRTGQAGAIA